MVVLLQLASIAAASAANLTADLVPLGTSARNGAPIPVTARLDWEGSGILEGRLDMEFHEGNRVLGRYRSDEMALAGGEQKFLMLLPPMPAPFSDSQVEVRMKFVTAANVIDLEPSVLFVPTTGQRSLVIGWFEPSIEAGQPFKVLKNLLFEQYAPPSDNPYQKLLTTSISRETPEDLPAEPLAYTAFDVVVLTADAFAQAHERQLQALARWVRGGGSVCVFAAGSLQACQIAFLNQLAASTSDGPLFFSDASGKLLPPQKDVLCLHSGIGRSVIITGETATTLNLDADEWREVAAFLWKMRNSRAQAIADTGHWASPVNADSTNLPVSLWAGLNTRVPRPGVIVRIQRPHPGQYTNAYTNAIRSRPARRPSYYYNYQNMQYGGAYSLAPQPTGLGAELLDRLMPKTVRLIPFPALITVLVLFLVVIGPADYYGLGFFRRRRLTWVLFPVTSIAFTAATVLMANHYLGLRDQRCSLTVVDLDKNGSALRWNRYELVFTARDKQVVTDLKDSLWAQLDTQMGPQYNNPYIRNPYIRPSYANSYRSYPYAAVTEDDADPPQYDGVLPVHFQTSESLHQWQPKLNRILSFESPPVPLPANWNAVERAWPNLEDIRAALSKDKPFNGDLCAFFSSDPMKTSIFNGILDPSIISEICINNAVGLQALVSQISPTGGSNFEDLPAVDPEAKDSVLVIVTKSGDNIVVYRRFFYGN